LLSYWQFLHSSGIGIYGGELEFVNETHPAIVNLVEGKTEVANF
jgi:hypothetical protein